MPSQTMCCAWRGGGQVAVGGCYSVRGTSTSRRNRIGSAWCGPGILPKVNSRDRDIGTHRLIAGYNRLYGWKPT
jgi:hypothetical protein